MLHPDEALDELESPTRAHVLGPMSLGQLARKLAKSHKLLASTAGYSVHGHAEQLRRRLTAAYGSIAEAQARHRPITPAAQWLLDNFHVVTEALNELPVGLPRDMLRALPRLALASGTPGPLYRVHVLLREFCAHVDYRFQPELLAAFLSAYQASAPLTMAELWSVPAFFRMAALDTLATIAAGTARALEARAVADELADLILGEGPEVPTDGHAGTSATDVRLPQTPLQLPFIVQLIERLRYRSDDALPGMHELRRRLATDGLTVDECVHREHQRQSANNASVANIITSLREIDAVDWRLHVAKLSIVETTLAELPSFTRVDEPTRQQYRQVIAQLAAGSDASEIQVARRARAAAVAAPDPASREADVGWHLLAEGRAALEADIGYVPTWKERARTFLRRHPGAAYLGSIGFLTAGIVTVALSGGIAAPDAAATLIMLTLAIVPASDLAVRLVNAAMTRLLGASLLPRLALRTGIPAAGKTLVAMPVMLTSREDIEEHCRQLEVHYLANIDPALRFALLSDWPDAAEELAGKDDYLLAFAREEVARLNASHPRSDGEPHFYLFHRRRAWNPGERCWMGWERKRGKLVELNCLLQGQGPTTFLFPPDTGPLVPAGVQFVLTLDADTQVPIGALRRLLGTALHPLNQPRWDATGERVTAGFGVLQPRVTPLLPDYASRSLFQWAATGGSGMDPYAGAVSDVYQDLFGQGIFTGKGLYHVATFSRAVTGRVPENAVLSHDLLEGQLARCGLVSDVELYEEFPSHSEVAAARSHRWTRGDWQLLPWLAGRPAGRPSVLHRWQIFDNLRRSLSAPAAIGTVVAAWCIPAAVEAVWIALILAPLLVPGLVTVLVELFSRDSVWPWGVRLRGALTDLGAEAGRATVSLALLGQNAWLTVDAITRALARLVTRRHLLEWITAAQVKARTTYALPMFAWPLKSSSVLVLLATAMILWLNPPALPGAAPWLAGLWAAPLFARWLSVPRAAARARTLTGPEAREVRAIARRTWQYFVAFVSGADHHLPPDNFQDDPEPVVAHRTSPTNIGLYLLSTLTARDFGWLGTADLAARLGQTLGTLEQLERCQGHFLNWYDTRTLEPLAPRYVSTVDSGNLAGHLLALKQGCIEILEAPALDSRRYAGLQDALALHKADTLPDTTRELVGLLADAPRDPADAGDWLRACGEAAAALAGAAPGAGPVNWAAALQADLQSHSRDLEELLPATLATPPADPGAEWRACVQRLGPGEPLRTYPERCHRAAGELQRRAGAGGPGASRLLLLAAAVAGAARRAALLVEQLEWIVGKAGELADGMDFGFLYDPKRELLSIGFRPDDATLDTSQYDLLASEARLASLLAIARGDVPVRHWFRLGRPLTGPAGSPVLFSWSGSMFEYLMPTLVMHSPHGSLLDHSCRGAVRRQVRHANARHVPWGISESAFNVRDAELTYQYADFGVPGLGLKRGLARNLVVAPYASLLAGMVDARRAVRNLRRLRRLGALGPFGYYDAIDFTPGRTLEPATGTVVRTFMAHHQGMSLVAAGNMLHADVMQRRFHGEPLVRAAALLLQEAPPRRFLPASAPVEPPVSAGTDEAPAPGTRRVTLPFTSLPVAHLLSNSRYAVMVTAAGSGYSLCAGRMVTRWREDAILERHGTFLYLRDCETNNVWSGTLEPVCTPPDSYEACLDEHRARFHRHDGTLATTVEVVVSPEEDAELRRVTVLNAGSGSRTIEITSYAEVVLAPQGADVAHPAFSNLFVETDHVPELGALLACRRPREADEQPLWAAHVICPGPGGDHPLEWETDRLRFLGRHGDVQSPAALTGREPLSGTVGPVLDPIFSLRTRLRVDPGMKASVTFATLVAGSRAEALVIADKLNNPGAFERAAMLSWTYARAGLHFLGVGDLEATQFQALATHVLFANPAFRAPGQVLRANHLPVTALWRLGISGDRPLVVVRCLDDQHQAMAAQLLRAQGFWAARRLPVDVVLLNERPHSYWQDLQRDLEDLVRRSETIRSSVTGSRAGQAFVLRREDLTADELTLLLAAARIVILPREGTLAEQIVRRSTVRPAVAPYPAHPPGSREESDAPAVPGLELANGTGGFAEDGREYVMGGDGAVPPLPWVNVIANPELGCLVSDSGASCTWAGNSRENQLTPWSNDPVTDPSGEVLYIRDDETRALWTPTPQPVRIAGTRYLVRHGQGYSRFQVTSGGIGSDLHVFVAPDDPVKISMLTLTNHSGRPRRLSIASFATWSLGASRGTGAAHIVTERHAGGALLARNPWNADFGSRVAFMDLGGAQTSFTCSRAEFLGRHGSLGSPLGLLRQSALSNRAGAGFDPCGALQASVELPPGATRTVVALLGQAGDAAAALALVDQYRNVDAGQVLAQVKQRWDAFLTTVQVRTPDRALDLLVNRWLRYQVLSCRFWGRAGFYQAGGAYGFRDQLQDSLALLTGAPGLVREHLLRAAARQFEAGDVQHWWHPPSGRGVRTRCVDDRLWLPFVLLRYLAATGDQGILEEPVPFLADRPLAPDEDDAHFEPGVSPRVASLYDHCALAIDASLGTGPHGLPLMGTGDWNDGMNRVGHQGTGESTWMAWFLGSILPPFAALARQREDGGRADQWEKHAEALAAAVESTAWDGEWYRRGYFDDGTPLGSVTRPECRIDSLAQSWAVLSGMADAGRARQAMASATTHLVRPDDELVLLLTPPFDTSTPDPGYIRGYLPGLRENGGQYTHAAVWHLIAEARLGREHEVAELLDRLNPARRTATRRGVAVYRTEPYALPGDVSSQLGNAGRGGWTWYTGAAGWLYQAVVEEILGVRIRADSLEIAPVLPAGWPGAELRYRADGNDYRVVIERTSPGTAVGAIRVDGLAIKGRRVALLGDSRPHRVEVQVGAAAGPA